MLQAVAGSGKTRCVIEKMRYLTTRGLVTKKQIMVFSYSKFTIEHFKMMCGSYSDSSMFVDVKLVKTIDAFCYDMIDRLSKPTKDDVDSEGEVQQDNCAVQVLSSRFLEYIQNQPKLVEKALKKGRYKDVKMIFIDEA